MVEKQKKRLKGAIITNYLLEKSRIISQAVGERNYHIFYHLLKGGSTELLNELSLTEMKDYEYLNKSNCYSVDTIDDDELFKEVSYSFRVIILIINILIVLIMLIILIIY